MRRVLAVVFALLMQAGLCGPVTSTAEFFANGIDTRLPKLASIPKLMAAGDEKGAEHVFAEHVRASLDCPRFIKAWRGGARTGLSEKVKASALRTMRFELVSCDIPHLFKDGLIDWTFNPTYNNFQEWPWQLSRHPYLTDLAEYYLETKDPDAVVVWMKILDSWMDQALFPGEDMIWYGTVCWRTMEAGIRMNEWSKQIHAFILDPAVTDAFVTRLFRSVYEHGRRIRAQPSVGNSLIMAMHGLARIGLFYPFLKDAAAWKDYAIGRLHDELVNQVRPDGFQFEQTPGYQWCVMANYRDVASAFREAGTEPPAFIADGLRKMYEVFARLSRPDGRTPALNDSGALDVAQKLAVGLQDFPDHPDFRWFATERREGTPPAWLSQFLPNAGIAVMRTDWSPDAVWACFDGGVFNEGWHMHEDVNNLTIFAYGKELLREAGSFQYDTSETRRYVVSTRAHNTVRIDALDQNRRGGYKELVGDITRTSGVEFRSTPDTDEVCGSFDGGYGPHRYRARHERKVLFCKKTAELPPFFVIVDRVSAPDANQHAFEVMWHLSDSALTLLPHGFLSDYGGGVTLRAVSSDVAPFVDQRGQKTPFFQGWIPISKTGPDAHRPIPTPVQVGSFAGQRRLVTVLQPAKGACVPVVRIEASSDVASQDIKVVLADGRCLSLKE